MADAAGHSFHYNIADCEEVKRRGEKRFNAYLSNQVHDSLF